MTPDQVAAWEVKARANFTYSTSADDQATWLDHSQDVLAGNAWTGDCDELAMTVVSLCALDGMPSTNGYRLFVYDVNGVGHMVGAIQCDDASWWVVGDTWFDAPYPAAQMPHTPKDYNCLAEAGPDSDPIWRAGVPWLAGQPLAA